MAWVKVLRWSWVSELGPSRVQSALGVWVTSNPQDAWGPWDRIWELHLAPLRGLPYPSHVRELTPWNPSDPEQSLGPWGSWVAQLQAWFETVYPLWLRFLQNPVWDDSHLLVTVTREMPSSKVDFWSLWPQVGVSKWKITPSNWKAMLPILIQAVESFPSGRLRLDGMRSWDLGSWQEFWKQCPQDVRDRVELVEEPWPWDPKVYAQWGSKIPLACDLLIWQMPPVQDWSQMGFTHLVWKPSLSPFQPEWLEIPGRILVTHCFGSWFDRLWSAFGDYWLKAHYPEKRWDKPGLPLDPVNFPVNARNFSS